MSVGAQSQPHDKISFSISRGPIISGKCAQFYASGLSLEGVARELGVAKATVLRHLQLSGMSLRPGIKTPEGKIARKQNRLGGHPPYGYVFIRGELVKHPKELEVVRKILTLWKSGSGVCAIASKLNATGYATRKGTPWRHPTITSIIRRESGKTLDAQKRRGSEK